MAVGLLENIQWFHTQMLCNPIAIPSTTSYDGLVIHVQCEHETTHFVEMSI